MVKEAKQQVEDHPEWKDHALWCSPTPSGIPE